MGKRTLRYETYDPEKEGYGNPDQWARTFSQVIGNTTSIEDSRFILGVRSNASFDEIKTAYRNLARIYHPDKPTGDIEKFHKISKSFKTLSESINSPIVVSITPRTTTTSQSIIIFPQLCNEIAESEVERYLCNPLYCAQEKHDGRRRILRYNLGITVGLNKKGKEIDCLDVFKVECKRIAEITGHSEFILDGEEVNDIFYVFDILSENHFDRKIETYQRRWSSNFLVETAHIKIVSTAYSESAKRFLLQSLKTNIKEGIVFKLLSGIHKDGYSDDWMKFKFYATASVIVYRQNERDSVGIAIYENGNWEPIGNVTTLGHVKPRVGSVIEVKYLYANRGGCLVQPAFLGVRDDVDVSDCIRSKIKFKNNS